MGFPCGSASKESAYSTGDLGSTLGLGRSPGEGKGYPLQYFDLENSIDCIVHGVANSWTRLSDFHFLVIYMVFLLQMKQNLETSLFGLKTRKSDTIKLKTEVI